MSTNSIVEFPVSAAIEHKQLPLASAAIHYFVAGRGNPEAILFLHPAFADHRCFYRQIDAFAASYCVITLDMAGHGLSQAGKSGVKLDATSEHVRQILLAEGFDRAHLVGVSLGGLMAQYCAVQHPAMAQSLAALGAYDINRANPEIANAQRSEMVKWMFKALVSMDAFRSYLAKGTVIHVEEQARFRAMAAAFTRRSFLTMGGMQDVIQERGPVLRGIPLLILVGDHDLPLAQRAAQKWHADEPGSRLVVISNAGHCANMDNSAEFNHVLMRFIQGAAPCP